MKVLAVLEAGDWIPSGVVRALIYRDLFARDGLRVEYVSRQPIETLQFLDDPRPGILRNIVWRRRIRSAIVARAQRRREDEIVQKALEADVVYLVKVTNLGLIQRLRETTRARIVLDFGDAVWLYDDRRDEPAFQKALTLVDAVTTDNELTADYVRRFNQRCTVIPDPPQIELFDRRRSELSGRKRDDIVLGWIGTASTLYNLYAIWEALEIIAQRNPQVTLRLVGAGHEVALRPPFERIRLSVVPRYDQSGMVEEIFGMHIGLFPLQRVEKSEVRGVLKAALYMSGEAAVIASPVGQVPELIQHGENGLLAASTEEWVGHLQALIDSEDLRRRLTERALQTVRERFPTERSWQLLRSVLTSETGAGPDSSTEAGSKPLSPRIA